MTKEELVGRIAADANVTKKAAAAAAALQAVVKSVQEALSKEDGSVRISDLGTFRVVQKKARVGVNPQTKKQIQIPVMHAARFTPAKSLRNLLKAGK